MTGSALGFLATAALAAGLTVSPVSQPRAEPAARTTRLALAVDGCDGCLVTPVQGGDGSVAALWRGRPRTVRDGVVHWRVATRHTVGLSFDIFDPGAVPLDWMTDVVVAYRGLAVGARVPRGVAARKRYATACWAGTRKSAVTLRVRVDRFPSTSDLPPPVNGYRIRPYVTRTLAHGRGYSRTFHGTIGNQDAYYCAR